MQAVINGFSRRMIFEFKSITYYECALFAFGKYFGFQLLHSLRKEINKYHVVFGQGMIEKTSPDKSGL
jgi:hypothetical protein